MLRIVFIHRTDSGELARTSVRPIGAPGSLGWTNHVEASFARWVGSQSPRPGDIFKLVEDEGEA